jgi:hypothetical protein
MIPTRAEEKIKHILESNSAYWDHDGYPAGPRREFKKVCLCRTIALGANVFASADEEQTQCFTCKSRACPSCGTRATLDWQRDKWCSLPDVSYTNVNFTMPGCFRPIFRANPQFEHDLAPLAANVLKSWAWRHHRVRVHVLVITQTFGSDLKYNPHLHTIVTSGGLPGDGREWKPIVFTPDDLWPLWRHAFIHYLQHVYATRPQIAATVDSDLGELLSKWSNAWWNLYVSREQSKYQFLRYAARYVRRLPIMQNRIVSIDSDRITYKAKRIRGAADIEIAVTPEEFIDRLAQHVQHRYRHSMRSFGLLSPRSQVQMQAALFRAIGQEPRPKAKRMSYEVAMRKYFGVNPRLDSKGNRMTLKRQIPPTQ